MLNTAVGVLLLIARTTQEYRETLTVILSTMESIFCYNAFALYNVHGKSLSSLYCSCIHVFELHIGSIAGKFWQFRHIGQWYCSGTSLLWTPWGPGKVPCIEKCPHFRAKLYLGCQNKECILNIEVSLFHECPLRGIPLSMVCFGVEIESFAHACS